MYYIMDLLASLESGLILALVISNFRLLKKSKNKTFILTFVLFVLGIATIHLKQISIFKGGFLEFSREDISLTSDSLLMIWLLFFLHFCKSIFNTKINNEALNKNVNALMVVILFLSLFNFVPTVATEIKEKISFGTVTFVSFVCIIIGNYYRDIQVRTYWRYMLSCLIAAISFASLFSISIFAPEAEAGDLSYEFCLYVVPVLYCVFFFVFLISMVENIKYIKAKKIKLEMRKKEILQKQAEEKHFKEASEQAHRMKIIEHEKEMEANLLMKMTARGKAIQKIADKASAESESKSGFIAFLSHEVRTPLNGIMGMVRMLENTKLDKKQKEFVDNLNYSGEALLSLLNDVLDFEKLSSDHMELENISFDFHKFADNITLTMSSKAEQQGIELKGEYDDKVPRFIKGDPTKLRQVMLNLIGNSVKFTKKGGVYVSFKTIKSDDKKCKIRAEVRDTGIGIAEDAKGKLFQDYVQVDSSTSRNFGGTGLGLSICKKLVESMDGEIGLISQEGAGSTFWWEVEFEVADKADEANEQRTEVALQKDKSYNVLVVEDDALSQQVVGAYLSSNGQIPKYASDGETANKTLKAGNIDFVFLDMGLPDMNGIEVCKFVREDLGDKDMPVIALTGNVSKEDQNSYIAQGVNFCLGKPISPEDVQQALFEIFKLLKDDDSSEGDINAQETSEDKKEETSKDDVIEKKEKVKSEIKITEEEVKEKMENQHKHDLEKILIVEDDIVSQKIIEGYLKNDAHNTSIVGTGPDALKAVEENKFDVVLMDINIPGKSGIEVTEIIRKMEDEDKANVPIIAITGNVSEEDIENCRNVGMNDFVAKPVDPDYLRGAIMRIANAGNSESSDFAFENINENLEKNQIPVPKKKNPIAVEVPADISEGNEKGLPYVLVIEDDLISQKIVSEYLVSFEYSPVVAGSAEEGLALIEKNNFLAVLMDIDLPGMDGIEATKTIRKMKDQIKANIAIIAITGNIKQEDVERCRDAGMNDFIGKPINPNYLKGALERNRGSVEHVDLEEEALMKHLDTEVLMNLKKSFTPEVFQGLMSQFGVSSEEAQKALMDAIVNEDRDEIKSKAHLLKGMSRNIGLKIIGNFMEELEKKSKEGDIQDIKDTAIESDEVLEEGKAALNAWFENWES